MRRAASAGSNPQLAGTLTRELTSQANLLLGQSAQSSGAEKYRLAESSNLKYRAALAFAPEKEAQKSLDARTLNALGYFLADKGSTRADFERAALLTRAAYQNWDMSGKFSDSNELGRAINAQDSYAWALFKLGRYEEALVQQKKVWDIVSGMGMADVTADIPFHLGEIYRALGQDKRARVAYEMALMLTTTEETRVLIEGGLKSLDLARV
jgi:tetratricopeptide (TPR) repeat protein